MRGTAFATNILLLATIKHKLNTKSIQKQGNLCWFCVYFFLIS